MTAPTAPFFLRTFANLELSARQPDGSLQVILQRGKPLALLAYCASARKREQSRDTLATLLWSDAPRDRARHNVRQALWRLRRLLGDLFVTREDAVLGVGADLASDRDLFLDAVYRQDAPDALGWYEGPFLGGITIPGGDEFDDWATGERRRLEDALLRVTEPYLRGDMLRMKPSERRSALTAFVHKVPTNPDARRIAIDVLLDMEDRVAAQGEADTMEQLAQQQEITLSPACAVSLARARERVDDESVPDQVGLSLDLVGRDHLFARVIQAWTLAKQGQCQVVLLTGVAGIGKSRLLKAVDARCTGRRSRALTVRANPGEQDVPFGYAAQVARALASLPGAAGINADSARELVALDPALGSRYAVSPSTNEGGESVRRRALALLDLLSAIAEQEPLALLLDDLHWADPASRQLLSIAIGRLSDLPLLVVGTTRPSAATSLDHSTLAVLSLPPLGADAVVDAIRSSGVWPDTAPAEHFIHTLADACDGIPLGVIERLSFAQESGLIALHDGAWSATDWPKAASEIAVSSPLSRRMAACSETERRLLLRLAVAGTPLSATVWLAHSPANADGSATTSVQSLEQKGLVVQQDTMYAPTHDVITEHLLSHNTPDAVREAHVQLATALIDSEAVDRLTTALRHFVHGGDQARAADTFAQVIARARRSGDPRHARDIMSDLLGDRLPHALQQQLLTAVPWRYRSARVGLQAAVFAAVIISVALTGFSWHLWNTPPIAIRQAALFVSPARLYGNDAYRLVPSIMVEVPSSPGDSLRQPKFVRVRSLRPGTSVIAGDSAAFDGGRASFGNLRLRTTDTIIALRFEADGHRPVEYRLDASAGGDSAKWGGSGNSGRVRLAEAQFGAQRVRGPDAQIVVQAGAMISGIVQMQYSAAWPAASVWASVTPTWGDPKAIGRELLPMLTPVNLDVIDLPVDVPAPTTPGRYWLLFLMNAEPAGMFGLSLTNWTLKEPLWNDGNDLASFPDSLIRRANRDGVVLAPVAYPVTWNLTGRRCRLSSLAVGGVPVTYCDSPLPMFGIQVVVR